MIENNLKYYKNMGYYGMELYLGIKGWRSVTYHNVHGWKQDWIDKNGKRYSIYDAFRIEEKSNKK